MICKICFIKGIKNGKKLIKNKMTEINIMLLLLGLHIRRNVRQMPRKHSGDQHTQQTVEFIFETPVSRS